MQSFYSLLCATTAFSLEFLKYTICQGPKKTFLTPKRRKRHFSVLKHGINMLFYLLVLKMLLLYVVYVNFFIEVRIFV